MENVYVREIATKNFKFPAGEVSVRLLSEASGGDTIVAHIQNSDDIMTLLMLNDSLRRGGAEEVHLSLPYVPYSRQDRVCNTGESLSIKVFADLINSCNFNTVTILDAHSDVTPALINNVQHRPQHWVFANLKFASYWTDVVIIAPDGGALKKAEAFAKHFGAKGVVAANKKRNVATGEIEYVKLTESVFGENVVVVDDICERGGTFIMLAEQLHHVQSKKLIVTHGIFSGGTKALTDVYDHVYTTNSYHRDLHNEEKLTVIKI